VAELVDAGDLKARKRVGRPVVSEEVWPPPASEEPMPPDPSRRIPFSDMITDGKLDVKDVL
jgi:hypothetical protein